VAILFIDKPQGITSYDVIRRLQKEMGKIKMGHAGTLDPMATGLLIVATESDTKKLSQFLKLSKVYEAEITLGKKTDTGDIEGEIIEEKPIPTLTKDIVMDIVKKMIGVLELAVPIYSAIKKEGKPLYEYAREGHTVELPIKKMEVISANVMEFEIPVIRIRFNVGSGTYIRTLAEELGQRLGTVATLSALRRISIGEYKIDGARHMI
jgi:tRNA pseudouridine55 synthase